jgi:phosphatidylglycerol:prolipoprotein diacylglycerol transferase
MLPALDLFGLSLPVGPLALLAAFYGALWLAGREAGRLGLDPELSWDFGTVALVAGIIGARLWYVAANWRAYALDWSQVFALAAGSLAVLPGAVIGLVAGLIWVGRRGVDWPRFADALAPGLALGQAVAALGAFLTGEAYGRAADVPWAVVVWGEPRHPVQLYEAGVSLVILGLLWYIRQRKPYAGFTWLAYLFLAAAGRLLVEGFRGNPDLTLGGLRTMQVLSLAVGLLALLALYAREAGIVRLQDVQATRRE